MRRHLLIIALFLITLFPAAAQFNWVMTHREWARNHYPDVDMDDDEKLLDELRLIICQNLQEPEALDLVSRASSKIPALNDYIEWRQSEKTDTLYNHTLHALGALCDYAAKNLPASYSAYQLKTAKLGQESFIRNVEKEWNQLIASYSSAIKKSPSPREKGLLATMKAIRQVMRNVRRNYDDPDEYPEIFDIEREGLEAYPVGSPDDDLQKAELYYWLGELKASMTNDVIAGLIQRVTDFNKDTEFEIIGSERDYKCNARFYYSKACDISSRLLNPGHPFARETARSLYSFITNTSYRTPEQYNNLRKEIDFMRHYFPFDSPEVAVARLLWSVIAMQNGLEIIDEAFLPSSIDTLEILLGTTNPIFHQHLVQMAVTILFSDPDNNVWEERLKETLIKSGISRDSDIFSLYNINLIYCLNAIDPEKAKESINQLYEIYQKNHNPTPLSMLNGRSLAYYYINFAGDKLTGMNILTTVSKDHHKPYGKNSVHSPTEWDNNLLYLSNPPLNSGLDVAKLYDSSLELLKHSNLPYKRFIHARLLYKKGTYLASAPLDFENAEKYYLECIDLLEIDDDPTLIISSLAQAAGMRNLMGRSTDEILPLLRKAEEIYFASSGKEVEAMTVMEIADGYYNEGLFSDAHRLYNAAMECYERLNPGNPYSSEYILLRKGLARSYDSLGMQSEARRIYGEDADLIHSSFGVTPNAALIDTLWEEYYKMRGDNQSAYLDLMPKLNEIMSLSMRLYNISGHNIDILDSYIIRLLDEIILLAVSSWDENFLEKVPGDSLDSVNLLLRQLESFAQTAEGWLSDFRQREPAYALINSYHSTLYALSEYYYSYKKDKEKYLSYMKELLGEAPTEQNLDHWFNYAGFLISDDQPDEGRNIVDLIEKSIPSFKTVADYNRDWIDKYRTSDLIAQGKYEAALPFARDYFYRHKNFLTTNFRLMTSKEQGNYMQTYGDPASLLAIVAAYLPDKISGETYDALLFRTGMQLRSARATTDAIDASGNPELHLMLDSINNLKNRLNAASVLNGYNLPDNYQARNENLGRMRHNLNRMEQKLLAAVKEILPVELSDITWQDIQKSLKNEEAAIEFTFSDNCVLALIIKKGLDHPLTVRLTEIPSLLEYLQTFSNSNSSARAIGLYSDGNSILYDMLWKPLETIIDDSFTIYYSAPGILSNIAFNPLTSPDGKTLFDKYRLVQLTTTALLAMDLKEAEPRSIAIMGDILYDENQKTLPITQFSGKRDIDLTYNFEPDPSGEDQALNSVRENLPSESRNLKKSSFRHLPFTALEIDGIAAEFPEALVDSARRLNATEERFRKMAAAQPDVIHLATHGYYIAPGCNNSSYPFLLSHGDGTMQRSGIALAGAEKTWRGLDGGNSKNDGILTAGEVAELDLRNTPLVALSACETALGDYSFEGIFGLQRGFKQAGVQSLLVSLWSVNDRSTSIFMQSFYHHLRNGYSRYESWRKAVESVRKEYPDPYFWAPFIILDAKIVDEKI